jgi:hypothetical protein
LVLFISGLEEGARMTGALQRRSRQLDVSFAFGHRSLPALDA